MKNLFLTFLLVFPLLLTTSCNKDDDATAPPVADGCWRNPGTAINFTVLSGPETELPNKVSVFFKLEDRNGNPIPRLTESDFEFYEQGLNDNCKLIVSADEADRRIFNSPQRFNYTTSLVLDLSGSVINNNLEELKQAALSFVNVVMPDSLDSGFRTAIYWFDGEDELNTLVPLTDDAEALIAGINSIDADISNDNSTDLFGAVIKTVEEAEDNMGSVGPDIITAAAVVLFTDGKDRAQRYLRNEAYTAVDNADPAISFFTIGLGSEINTADLQKFGADGFRQAQDLDGLISVFNEVGTLVIDQGDSYYNFEYCSPIRNGTADLIIQANAPTGRGYTEFTYDGTGFEGGCSL